MAMQNNPFSGLGGAIASLGNKNVKRSKLGVMGGRRRRPAGGGMGGALGGTPGGPAPGIQSLRKGGASKLGAGPKPKMQSLLGGAPKRARRAPKPMGPSGAGRKPARGF